MLSVDERLGHFGGPAPLKSPHFFGPMSASVKPIDNTTRATRHMWIVTGPAGCGKSTVAAMLAQELHIPYVEGDDLHPPSNRKKMESGIPLNDEDRWDWLVTLREAAVSALDSSQTNATAPMQKGVVVTCSALKHKYRDVIRVAAYNDHRVHVHFIYLHASEAVLTERVRARKGHYMGANMVQSQFAVLEAPDTIECKKDVLVVDCSGSQESVSRETLDRVRAVLTAHSEELW